MCFVPVSCPNWDIILKQINVSSCPVTMSDFMQVNTIWSYQIQRVESCNQIEIFKFNYLWGRSLTQLENG